MSKPSAHAWKAVKRVCGYFISIPRLVYFWEQQTVDAIDVNTDTDWAGCPLTRTSTSGGFIMVGKHAIKHWSSTQSSISLSSGEAEFAGVIRGSGQGLGYQSLMNDADIQLPFGYGLTQVHRSGYAPDKGLGSSGTWTPTPCGYNKLCAQAASTYTRWLVRATLLTFPQSTA